MHLNSLNMHNISYFMLLIIVCVSITSALDVISSSTLKECLNDGSTDGMRVLYVYHYVKNLMRGVIVMLSSP